jgi:RNA polymerase sigma-70 factor (ECF subfamily)
MWILGAIADLAATASADRLAVERMARGDHDGLAELYDRHGRLVYSLALRIMRDQGEAEDVVQEVFTQVWQQASRYRESRGNVIAWMLTLARSRAIDRLRRRASRPQDAGEAAAVSDIADSAAPVDQQLAWAGRAAQIRSALDELPLLQRIAIELAFYEGLTHHEVAERLELPLGTIKTRIRQGLLNLRDRLTGQVE